MPPPTSTPTFLNPYADDPERAEAYRAGYIEGAFGMHSNIAPPPDEEPLTEIWLEGNAAGLERFSVYRNGYKKGINAGLWGQPAPSPPHSLGGHLLVDDLLVAWSEGRDAGVQTASEVADEIGSKALTTGHFSRPDWPIRGRLHMDNDWWYWQTFDGGQRCVFLRWSGEPPRKAYAVDAPMFAAYDALGGLEGVLKWPTNDTTICQGTTGVGRYNAFHQGEIYATAETLGVVRGGNLAHWHSLGGPRSYLGYPTNVKDDLDEGGWGNTFQNGDIYWWPGEPRPIDLRRIEIRYRGMNCFGDTDELGADEPYPIFTVLGPVRRIPDGSYVPEDGLTYSRVGPMESAVGGGSYPKNEVVYYGPIGKVGGIAVLLLENDRGDPNAYRGTVEAAVRTALGAAGAAIAATGVGLPVAALAAWLGQAGAGPLTDLINGLIGSGDDTIGSALWCLSPRVLYDWARSNEYQHERDIKYKFGGDALLSGDGGSYKTYFDVVFAE